MQPYPGICTVLSFLYSVKWFGYWRVLVASLSLCQNTLAKAILKESISLGLMFLESSRVHGHPACLASSTQAQHWSSSWKLTSSDNNHKVGGTRGIPAGMIWTFETSKLIHSDIPLPTRPYLLILPKQFHQLRAKRSLTWPMGAILIHTTTWCLVTC